MGSDFWKKQGDFFVIYLTATCEILWLKSAPGQIWAQNLIYFAKD